MVDEVELDGVLVLLLPVPELPDIPEPPVPLPEPMVVPPPVLPVPLAVLEVSLLLEPVVPPAPAVLLPGDVLLLVLGDVLLLPGLVLVVVEVVVLLLPAADSVPALRLQAARDRDAATMAASVTARVREMRFIRNSLECNVFETMVLAARAHEAI